MKDIMRVMRVMKLWEKAYPIVMDLERDELLILCGMAIDYNSSKNGENPAEYIDQLAIISKQVNEQEGRA